MSAISENFKSFLAMLQLSPDGIALAAPNPWRFVFLNATSAAWARSTGDTADLPIEQVLRDNPTGRLSAEMERILGGEADVAIVSAKLIRPDGDARESEIELRLTRLELDQPYVGVVMRRLEPAGVERPTNERRDPLTGLADRSLLSARLNDLLTGDRLADQKFAVLFIDLDNFKQVNDCYGHLIGDLALREVAHRLEYCTRGRDQVFRFGGDEFVVLLDQVAGWEEYEPVIARIHAAIAAPIPVSMEEVFVSVSIGAAQAGVEYRTPDEILSAADRAMYAAKRLSSAQAAL